MPTTLLKRVQGAGIDMLLVCMVVWASFGFNTHIYKKLTSFVGMVAFGFPQLFAWQIPVVLFLVGPLLLFASFLFFSATPGQHVRGLREVQAATSEDISILQALILSLCFVPSAILLNFLPQVFAFLNYDHQTLLEFWLRTRVIRVDVPKTNDTKKLKKGAIAKKHEVDDEEDRELSILLRVRVGVLMVILSVQPILTCIALHKYTTFYKIGIMVGGTAEDRETAYNKIINPDLYLSHVAKIKSESPEECFLILNGVLKSRDPQELLDILTGPSLLMLKASGGGKGDLFADLPDGIEMTRREGKDTDAFVKIYYHELHRGQPDRNELFMTFAKEDGKWRVDLVSWAAMQMRTHGVQRKP